MAGLIGGGLLIFLSMFFYILTLTAFYFLVSEYNKTFRENDPFNKVGLTLKQKILINVLSIFYLSFLLIGRSIYVDLNLYINEVYFIIGEILFYYFVKDFFKENAQKSFYYTSYIFVAILFGFAITLFNY